MRQRGCHSMHQRRRERQVRQHAAALLFVTGAESAEWGNARARLPFFLSQVPRAPSEAARLPFYPSQAPRAPSEAALLPFYSSEARRAPKEAAGLPFFFVTGAEGAKGGSLGCPSIRHRRRGRGVRQHGCPSSYYRRGGRRVRQRGCGFCSSQAPRAPSEAAGLPFC